MKIGVRAHDYGKRGIEELADLLRREGYEAAQLALPKAFKEINSYQDIRPSHLERIRKAFADNQVTVPVFGCYMDLGNPDQDIRAEAVETLKKCLSCAKEMGADVVGTETAYPRLSDEEKIKWRPFMMDSLERVMEEAVRVDMKLAVEPVYSHALSDLETTMKVIEKIKDADHLRLIFDAANLLEFPETTDQNSYWEEWLYSVGPYIDVMHIKDFCVGENGSYEPVRLGTGVMNYEMIARWLSRCKREIPLLREEMNPVFAREDIEFLKKMSI